MSHSFTQFLCLAGLFDLKLICLIGAARSCFRNVDKLY